MRKAHLTITRSGSDSDIIISIKNENYDVIQELRISEKEFGGAVVGRAERDCVITREFSN